LKSQIHLFLKFQLDKFIIFLQKSLLSYGEKSLHVIISNQHYEISSAEERSTWVIKWQIIGQTNQTMWYSYFQANEYEHKNTLVKYFSLKY